MNEQLIVKNFGPIKDATVDFKRVTVFIGPTGGGKSTLAKLAAILRSKSFHTAGDTDHFPLFRDYNIYSFLQDDSRIDWDVDGNILVIENRNILISDVLEAEIRTTFDKVTAENSEFASALFEQLLTNFKHNPVEVKKLLGEENREKLREAYLESAIALSYQIILAKQKPSYIPAERLFVPSIEYSWAGLMRDDIGLSKTLLDFANNFSLSRKEIHELDISFLNIKYLHIDGRDFIKIPEREEPLMLLEAASGIQSVTPLLVLLEYLNRDTERSQSFIIEEPELNLYPTAQRDLIYWLLEKCTYKDNDLTITTHSPYVLSALNLALYANKVAELFPHQRQKVAKIIPAKYWLKTNEFSAYYVVGGGAKSIFNQNTGLLSESQLDEVSGHFADVFDRLTDLRVPEKKASLKVKSIKK